jgi:DNA-binding MarR family transcriptional regulator
VEAHVEDEVEQAARLRVAVARLARQLRQQTMGGLTPSQLSCLTSVERMEPVRLAELAAREAVAPPTLTRIVAVLVELGVVERQADPVDARAARITTTPSGREALQRVREERTAFLVDRLHALPDQDRRRLPALVALLEHLAEAAPAGDEPAA